MKSKLITTLSFLRHSIFLGFFIIFSGCGSNSDSDSGSRVNESPQQNLADLDTLDDEALQEISIAKICFDRGFSLESLDDSAGLDGCLVDIIRTKGLRNGSVKADVEAIQLQAEAIKSELPMSSPLVSLGKRLFFNKNLGGDFDASCGTCHDPRLGGADSLSLAIGVSADDPELLGVGRTNQGVLSAIPNEPRHALSTFNVGLHEHPGRGLLWDMRIEPIGPRSISSPDSAFNSPDPNAQRLLDDDPKISLIDGLVSTLAGFPITDPGEMRGTTHSLLGSLDPDSATDNQLLRDYLAGRFRSADFLNESEPEQQAILEQEVQTWYSLYQAAFPQQADAALDELISFPNIARAISAFIRQQIYINNPWYAYVLDSEHGLSNSAKRGAILFYTSADPGTANNHGADCARCHGGATFSIPDQSESPTFVRRVGFPQIGEGRGCPNSSNPDFSDSNDCGRHNISGDPEDLFKFRVPTLLNIECTKPYGHTGSFVSLDQVVQFFDEPYQVSESYFAENRLCDLPQFKSVGMACDDLLTAFPGGLRNTQHALGNPGDNDLRDISINDQERKDLVQFLYALTDPAACDSLSPENLSQLPDNDDSFANQLTPHPPAVDGNVNIIADQIFQ